jgi:hypothetical protein
MPKYQDVNTTVIITREDIEKMKLSEVDLGDDLGFTGPEVHLDMDRWWTRLQHFFGHTQSLKKEKR